MDLHSFFLVIEGQRLDLTRNIDSAGLAQEQAERQAAITGKPVLFFSTTLLGEVGRPIAAAPSTSVQGTT